VPSPGYRLNRPLLALLALAVTGLVGCAHNDVLVFGTDTKMGLDIETAATQGASPSITIGYKRKEAVWMPLVVNGQGSDVAACSPSQVTRTPLRAAKTCRDASSGVARDDILYQSQGPDGERDAYSVFASLGARIEGDGRDTKASMGIAQFFATGGAAINLTRNEALVTALKIESEGGAKAQAEAVRAASGAGGFDALIDRSISPADQVAITGQVIQTVNLQRKTLSQIRDCARAANGDWRWGDIVDAMLDPQGQPLDQSTRTVLKTAKNETELEALIGPEREWITSAKTAAVSKQFCS